MDDFLLPYFFFFFLTTFFLGVQQRQAHFGISNQFNNNYIYIIANNLDFYNYL